MGGTPTTGRLSRGHQGRKRDEKGMAIVANSCESDPAQRDKTAYFITGDAGRHLDGVANGFIDHGDNCEDAGIFLFSAGRILKEYREYRRQREQIDIAADAG